MSAPDRPLQKPLGPNCVHLCIDMQNLFSQGSDWFTPWMPRVLPLVVQLVEAHPSRTVFTRFIPAARPGEGRGTWADYYRHWPQMTLEALPPEAVELVPGLLRFAPPARVVDKAVYSPWIGTGLDRSLRDAGVDTLVISGAETDVCVLAAVLGAVDFGYRVVLPRDAMCSSSDAMHDALLDLYRHRYGRQVEVASVAHILEMWR